MNYTVTLEPRAVIAGPTRNPWFPSVVARGRLIKSAMTSQTMWRHD